MQPQPKIQTSKPKNQAPKSGHSCRRRQKAEASQQAREASQELPSLLPEGCGEGLAGLTPLAGVAGDAEAFSGLGLDTLGSHTSSGTALAASRWLPFCTLGQGGACTCPPAAACLPALCPAEQHRPTRLPILPARGSSLALPASSSPDTPSLSLGKPAGVSGPSVAAMRSHMDVHNASTQSLRQVQCSAVCHKCRSYIPDGLKLASAEASSLNYGLSNADTRCDLTTSLLACLSHGLMLVPRDSNRVLVCRHASAQAAASESLLESLGWGTSDVPVAEQVPADPQVCAILVRQAALGFSTLNMV